MMRFSLVFILLFYTIAAMAQPAIPFISGAEKQVFEQLEKTQINYLHNEFALKNGLSNELINGKEYISYYFRSKLKPLLYLGKERMASISINNRLYDNITLQYDFHTDEVIYTDTSRIFRNRMTQVALNKDNVDYFKLYFNRDTLHFKYLTSEVVPDFNLQKGFYELAYYGQSQYLIKHQSKVYERNGIDQYFYSPAGFVNVGSGYYEVKSARQFTKLFGDKSPAVKKFIHSRKIKIRKADKKQIVSVLKFYDSLKTSVN